MKTSKILSILLLSLGVAASPLLAQDNTDKSLGEKTSESLEKAKDKTVEEGHKVGKTTRKESHKVADSARNVGHKVGKTTRKESHKVANTARHEGHKVGKTVRKETGTKSETSSDTTQKDNGAATPQ